MELSQGTKKLLLQYQLWYQGLEPKENIATITVDEVAARVALFYEKIRGVVDWREEHLLRKTAIERMLKRRLLFGNSGKDMAEPLLHELIRGGHFPNSRLPLQTIDQTQEIINKYTSLIEQSKLYGEKKLQTDLEDWLLTVGACEIEETLSLRTREKALIEFMAQNMEKQIQIRKKDENRILPEERIFEIYVAVQRSLFKLDDATITLHLLEKSYPEWEHLGADSISSLAPRLQSIKMKIESILVHPLADKFYNVVERYDTPYLLLGDIISEDPNKFTELTQNSQMFEVAIEKIYAIRLKKLRARMNRTAFFSTLSVFLSKVLIVLAVELPVDANITHELNYVNLAWSIAIPPLFLLLLVKTIKSSTSENIQKTLLEVAKITFETNQKEVDEISLPRKRGAFLSLIIHAVYLGSFVVSFGFLASMLRKLHFSFPSIVVFLLFFSLVAFAGTKIRSRARELMVGKEKEGFLQGLLDFFGLPIIQVGKWLSGQISRFNILILLLNVFIEAPFQVFVEFIEQLRTFWKEKKEEIH